MDHTKARSKSITRSKINTNYGNMELAKQQQSLTKSSVGASKFVNIDSKHKTSNVASQQRQSSSPSQLKSPPANSKKPTVLSLDTKIKNSTQKQIGDHHHHEEINKKRQLQPIELVKRRLNALRLLQMESAKLEAKFYEEIYLLECKYNKMSRKLKQTRNSIISGSHEPTDSECNVANASAINTEIDDGDLKVNILAGIDLANDNINKGLPDFWLTVFKRVGLISEIIEDYDEPVLKYLSELDVDYNDEKPYSFTLNFHFLPNEYFTNTVLTKTYIFKIEVDPNEPLVFDAPEIQSAIGCEINWKKNKNLTKPQKLIESDYFHEATTAEVEERAPSFFNFFDMKDFENKSKENMTQDEVADLIIDHEIGYIFKETVIPKAILYFMGEISDDTDANCSDFENDEEDESGENRVDLECDSEDNSEISNKLLQLQRTIKGHGNLNKN